MFQPDFVFRGHQSAVNSVCFFADDRFLVSADQDGNIIVWNMLLKRQLVRKEAAHSAPVLSACGIGTDMIVSQGRDNRLCLWRLDAGEFSGSLTLLQAVDVDSMNFCKFSYCKAQSSDGSSGALWIAALEDAGSGKGFLYNVDSNEKHSFGIGRKTRTMAGGREDSPMCMKLVSETDRRFVLFVGYESTLLQRFEIEVSDTVDKCVAKCTDMVDSDHKEPIMSMDIDPQQQLIYTCSADNKVCRTRIGTKDPSDGTPTGLLSNKGGSDVCLFNCSVSPGQFVAVAGWDYAIHILDKDLKYVSRVAYHREALTSIDVSSQSMAYDEQIADEMVRRRWSLRPRWLVAASRDSRISLWSVDSLTKDPA
ncbi:Astra associated protein 1 Asa1 [Coemansia sp. IMI 203386]|nr:Astra associated protein 1 Asa1 [Coemansia sp. IMI 203386]